MYGDLPVKNGGTEKLPAVEVVLSPDGKQALTAVGYQIYLIDRDLRQSRDGFTFNARAIATPEPPPSRREPAAAAALPFTDCRQTNR